MELPKKSTRELRLLIIAPFAMDETKGGVQRVSCVLARSFAKKGHHVEFLCSELYCKEQAEFYQNCIQLNKLTKIEGINQYIQLLTSKKFNTVIFQVTDSRIEELLINTPKTIACLTAVHIQPYSGFGYERQMHRYYRPDNIKHLFYKWCGILTPVIRRFYEKKCFDRKLSTLGSNSDKVILLSKNYLERIKHVSPDISLSNFCAISNPNTFNLSDNSPNDLFAKENLVLFVGRLENCSKNIKGFIDVWNLIRKNTPDWEAIVVGDGPDRQVFEKYVRKNGINNLKFIGYQEDTAKFYKRAKIILITSFGEGFSLALTEAMSYGVVPIAFNTYEALSDIIIHGKTGFIIPPLKNKIMAKMCLELMEDSSLLRKLSQSAKLDITKFDAEFIVSKWINLIQSILDSKNEQKL